MFFSHPPRGGRSQSSSFRPRSDSGLALWRVEDDDWLLLVLALRHSWKLYSDDWKVGATHTSKGEVFHYWGINEVSRGQRSVPTWGGEAAVHVGSIPGLHSAVHGRQCAECSLACRRCNHDNRLLLPILVLQVRPHSWPQTRTNHARLWAWHCRQTEYVCQTTNVRSWI